MLYLLLFSPLAAALLCLALAHDWLRRWFMAAAGAFQFALALYSLNHPPEPAFNGLLELDGLGGFFLCITSLLFCAASLYAVGYLASETKGPRSDFQEGTSFSNAPERIFCACLLGYLAAMTLVCSTRNLGALWVGIEATTLASAPLIYFHRHRRSLEATWKYLIICSVGIALALLGNILMSVAFFNPAGNPEGLNVGLLSARAASASQPWLKAAFIFLLVGYGTKMGLAPMHNWLPDAHSQAPSLVSALLSGALLNSAFLGILRSYEVCQAAGLSGFCQELLLFFGLFSMLLSAAFIVGLGDYKRVLAYSSVEHMGILAVSVGIGGAAVVSGMLHSLAHSLTKAMLFLAAGNILALYHTRSSYDARGITRSLPITACLWTAGFLSITGTPPFAIFASEFGILTAMLSQGALVSAGLYLLALAIIFVGMSRLVTRMLLGPVPPAVKNYGREPLLSVIPPIALGILVLALGMWQPVWLKQVLLQAAKIASGGS